MRKRLILDVETNGLLPELTAIHSLVLRDRDDPSWVMSCSGRGDTEGLYLGISQGLLELYHAEVIYAHNGLTFDLPALKKVFGWTPGPNTKVLDTLVASRLVYSDQKEHDFELFRRKKLPGNLIGRHSLEAWGVRLNNRKLQSPESWEKWTPEMQMYCEQDTLTTYALIEHLAKRGVPMQALEAEQDLQLYLWHQELNGWPFNEEAARTLQAELAAKRETLRSFLVQHFGTWTIPSGPIKVAKVNYAKRGIPKGTEYQNFKVVEFNPASRSHIAKRLMAQFNWVPEKFTETNQPQVDETVLEGLLHIPGVPELKEFLLVEKRLGQIAEGQQAWLKLVKGGKIHGRINPIGAITHRATHSNPNLSQVPAVTAEYGERCRGLFHVPEGWQQMGADASGLELRCLAHYMAKYDDGAYAKVLLEADVHTANQMSLGEFVPEGKEGRNLTKTWVYAVLYGAGDEKLGKILKPGLTAEQQEQVGSASRATFLRNTPALKYLLDAVKTQAKRVGYFTVLDGRRVYVRSEHAALNTLLQSTGAVICKHWIVGFDYEMTQRFGPQGWGGRWAALGWIHDEIQIAVRPAVASAACELAVKSIERLTALFSFRCPLTGEAKLGSSWAATH